MRLDFDFHGGAGYVIARREVAIELPENYQFVFWIRGEAPANNLELKFLDATGDNVWWLNRRNFEFPRQWKKVLTRQRQIEFAWGTSGGGELRRVAAIEFAISAGSGGRGSVWIDELALVPLEKRTTTAPPLITSWRSPADGTQSLSFDLGGRREIGGVVIDWHERDYAVAYDVEVAHDGAGDGNVDQWEMVERITRGNGGRDYLYLPDIETTGLRIVMRRSSRSRGYAVRRAEAMPLAWSQTANEFFFNVAASGPRGDYPRSLHRQQSYWTVIGVDGDVNEALINEDGAIEPFKSGFSLEPFLYDRRLISWDAARVTQSLRSGYAPIPTVAWKTRGIDLTVTAFAGGKSGRSTLYARYRVRNRTARAVKLFLAVRPFQVNPPWQFLNTPGGFAKTESIRETGGVTRVDGQQIMAITLRRRFGAATFEEGNIVDFLRRGQVPLRRSVKDTHGFASAALEWSIAPRSTRNIWIAVPMHDRSPIEDPLRALSRTAREWDEKLNRVVIDVPDRRLSDTIRATLAYILINRDGAAIQPGSRSYERSWIRDGSLTSAALLRLGHAEDVRQFVEWFAAYQFPNGKVPCCVDLRGADPVPEHDSHGELLFIIAEYHRYTRDLAFLRRMWPHVEKATEHIEFLRKQRMTPEYAADEKRAFFGLLPESISHEGYSAKPMHSYWDDFFAVKGLGDAAYVADALGKEDAGERFTRMRDEMRSAVAGSISRTMAAHRIDYIPASVELGDYDPTSTTIAIAPGGELPHLPADAVQRTFDRYYQSVMERRSTQWDAYTPYELRSVGTFIRLGNRERAHALLEFFFNDQRPAGWRQWAEVVWREPRTPKFIGDMPHTWVGSDFIRSALDLFAYEREDGALVLGAGVKRDWLPSGVRIRNLRTSQGRLSYDLRGSDAQVRMSVTTKHRRIVIRPPLAAPIRSVTINGTESASFDAEEVRLDATPADVVIRY